MGRHAVTNAIGVAVALAVGATALLAPGTALAAPGRQVADLGLARHGAAPPPPAATPRKASRRPTIFERIYARTAALDAPLRVSSQRLAG